MLLKQKKKNLKIRVQALTQPHQKVTQKQIEKSLKIKVQTRTKPQQKAMKNKSLKIKVQEKILEKELRAKITL